VAAQSDVAAQRWPSAQPLGVPPPQSTSVSAPFLTLSTPAALHRPVAQTPLSQSVLPVHTAPVVPFDAQVICPALPAQRPCAHCHAFVQAAPSSNGRMHLPPPQTNPAAQSLEILQENPSPQRAAQEPPQLTSVSSPFFFVSVPPHVAGEQRGGAATAPGEALAIQKPVLQSASSLQTAPTVSFRRQMQLPSEQSLSVASLRLRRT
jgi:hypothetical protein